MLPAARHPVAPAPLRPRHSTCTAALRGLVREDQFRPLGAATMRRQLVAFGWALAALLVLLPARLAFAAEPSAGLVPQAVHDKAQQNGWTRVLVEVATPGRLLTAEGALSASAVAGQRAGIATAQNAALGRLAATGAAVVHRYRSVPFLALQVDAAALRELDAARAEVIRVVEDQLSLPLLYQSIPLVQGDQAWARGYEGTGATVAVLDTGVDRLHPFLAGKVVDEGCFSSGDFHFCPDGQTQALGPGTAAPCPFMAICQHGTGVAGIATGNGAGFGMPFSGVAKSASVAAYQVFSAFEAGDNLLVGALDSDILAALDHVITVHAAFNIVAVNMSLGAGRLGRAQAGGAGRLGQRRARRPAGDRRAGDGHTARWHGDETDDPGGAGPRSPAGRGARPAGHRADTGDGHGGRPRVHVDRERLGLRVRRHRAVERRAAVYERRRWHAGDGEHLRRRHRHADGGPRQRPQSRRPHLQRRHAHDPPGRPRRPLPHARVVRGVLRQHPIHRPGDAHGVRALGRDERALSAAGLLRRWRSGRPAQRQLLRPLDRSLRVQRRRLLVRAGGQ